MRYSLASLVVFVLLVANVMAVGAAILAG